MTKQSSKVIVKPEWATQLQGNESLLESSEGKFFLYHAQTRDGKAVLLIECDEKGKYTSEETVRVSYKHLHAYEYRGSIAPPAHVQKNMNSVEDVAVGYGALYQNIHTGEVWAVNDHRMPEDKTADQSMNMTEIDIHTGSFCASADVVISFPNLIENFHLMEATLDSLRASLTKSPEPINLTKDETGNEEKVDSAEGVKNTKTVYNRTVKHVFSDVEKLHKADQLAEAMENKLQAEEEFDTIKKNFKAKIEAHESAAKTLQREIRSGFEMRVVAILERRCNFETQKAEFVIPHTNTVVDTEPLTAEDHQLSANFPE